MDCPRKIDPGAIVKAGFYTKSPKSLSNDQFSGVPPDWYIFMTTIDTNKKNGKLCLLALT